MGFNKSKMLVRKIVFPVILLTIVSSCSNLVFSPPPISDESIYFENEYFGIWYPKGWIIAKNAPEGNNIVDLVFYDPRYNKYLVNVIISNSIGVSARNLISGELFQKYLAGEKRLLDSYGITNVSCRTTSFYLDGRPAEDIISEGSNDKGTVGKHMILLDINPDLSAQIMYGCFFASETTKERMRRIVESVHFK